MLTIYLDQAQWIDLSRARHGRADGARFASALNAAQQAVSLELAQFPLSMGHYIETWRASNSDRRRRLAQTMIELSQGRTMARPPDLCDNELDAFISQLSAMPPVRPPWPPLGWGYPHGSGAIRHPAKAGGVALELELERLAERPDGFLAHGGGHRDFADLYREGEEGLVAGLGTKDQAFPSREAIIAVSAVTEIHENIGWALERAGLPGDALGPIGLARPDLPEERVRDVLEELLPLAREFIAKLPTRDAVLRLRLLRHQNSATNWERNDMIDIAYLACAVVHCDLVVTERQWVHELKRSGLLEEHDARAMHDVAELPEVLVDLIG